ncbi:MAG: hypothetical protein LBQ59_04915 [Candidatus Peribacteria bacterium]|nr:hypothetical protein [Candidatus Peribacteria bacterium]
MHQISIDITDEQYDFIVNAYKADESAEKEWVKVNITIDGILINNVGLRLK